MPELFLIFALPRSRTAWLSNLFTVENVFCHHDGMRKSRNPPSLKGVLDGHGVVGNCDNAMAVFAEEVLEEWPDARVALIQRDPQAVVDSLRKFHRDDGLPQGAIDSIVHQTQQGLDRVALSGRVDLSLSYEALDSLPALGRLWGALVPSQGFDGRRAEALLSYQVQMHRPTYNAAMTPEWVRLAHETVTGGMTCRH